MATKRDDAFYEIESVSKAAAVLEVVVEERRITEKRIVAKTRLSRDTVMRTLKTWRLRGYLAQDPKTFEWFVGPRLTRLGHDLGV